MHDLICSRVRFQNCFFNPLDSMNLEVYILCSAKFYKVVQLVTEKLSPEFTFTLSLCQSTTTQPFLLISDQIRLLKFASPQFPTLSLNPISLF